MRAGIAAFSCGVILLYCSGLSPVWPCLIVALFALLVPRFVRLSPRFGVLANVLACLLLGYGWASWHATERIHSSLPISLEGAELVVTGYLCDIPSPGIFDSVRFSFCVSNWQGESLSPAAVDQLPSKLRLAWYGDDATRALPHRLRLTVSLKRPHGSVNPAGFRYETWLFRHEYRATGTVRSAEPWRGSACYMECQYHRWRNILAQNLEARLGTREHYPIVEALLIGQRGHMTPDHWQTFQDTGTIHLVAISGLHIGLVAVGLGWVLTRILVWLPQHWWAPSRRRALVFAGVVAGSLLYALVAGFTVPTRRALIMVVVAAWLVFRAGRTGAWSAWLLALFLVVLLDPFAPLDRGFWLSFGAVAVLVVMFSGRLAAPSPLAALVLAQCGVFAGLWPVLNLMDQPPAVLGWFANLIAIPWVSLVVMPVLMAGALILAAFPFMTEPVGLAFDSVLGLLWWFLSTLAEVSVPVLAGGLVSALAIALTTLAILVFPITRVRLLAGALVVIWLVGSLTESNDDKTRNRWTDTPELWVWDVGQGLAVMFRHRDQVLLYDSGPETPAGYSAVASELLPSLTRLGVRRINVLILSHGDADHAGGLDMLYRRLRVDRTLSGEPARILAGLAPGKRPEIGPCTPGNQFGVGVASVTLWQDAVAHRSLSDSNDASCIATIRYGDISIVLPGDSSRRVEAHFLQHESIDDAYRILIAGHHGSNTSSGQSWIDTIDPADVIYSAGYRHRYGHPHPDVVDRFDASNARSFNTAYSGALKLTLDRQPVTVTAWRADAPFWIRPVEDHWKAR